MQRAVKLIFRPRFAVSITVDAEKEKLTAGELETVRDHMAPRGRMGREHGSPVVGGSVFPSTAGD